MSKFPENLPNWLRWVIFLPASVAAFLVAYWVAVIGGRIMNFLGPAGGAAWGDNFFVHLLGPGFAGYASIFVVQLLVPKKKRLISLLASGIWLLLLGFLGTYAVLTREWPNLLGAVSSAVGILVALNSEEFSD